MYDEDLLAKRIRQERNAREWSQAQLAEQLTKRGVPCRWSTISKVEAGTRPLRAAEAAAIADAFGMSLDVLVGRLRQPAGDLGYLRRGLVNTATNVERLLGEMAEALGNIISDCADGDPEGVLSAPIEAGKSLNAQIRAAVLIARQMIREGESE